MINKIKTLLEKIKVDDIDIESNIISLPLRHYKYELNKSTPFVWAIDSNNEKKYIKISITVDKNAVEKDKDIESIVLNSIKYNDTFKELVDTLEDLQPDNSHIKDLYNMEKYKRRENKDTVVYTKNIKFGERK